MILRKKRIELISRKKFYKLHGITLLYIMKNMFEEKKHTIIFFEEKKSFVSSKIVSSKKIEELLNFFNMDF